MDGQPHSEAHRRGGSRGGGLRRKNSGRGSYRRVQASGGDGEGGSATADAQSSNGHAARRSVQVVGDDKPAAAPFRSSLKESLRHDAPAKPDRKTGERAHDGRTRAQDRSRERPRSARGRSPAPHKRELQLPSAGAPKLGERKVISLSSPSPQKAPGQTKRFVSSLVQSIDRSDQAPKLQDRDTERGGRGGRGGPQHGGGSQRRAQGRDDSHQPSDEQQPSRRHVERGAPSSRNNRSRSSSRPKLSRKGSADSISSQTSVRSERNHRRDRGPRGSSPPRVGGGGSGLRSSLTGGDPRDKNGAPRVLRRLSSDSSFKSSVASTASSQDVRMSAQDARVQKPRPSSSRMDRGAHASHSRSGQDASTRRSSLDGEGVSQHRLPGRSMPQDARSGAPDGRAGLETTPSDAARHSPVSAAGGLRKNASAAETASARGPPPPSPVCSPTTQEKEDKPPKTPPPPSVDEAERKRLANKLKERMEARKLERGGSLAQMMKAPLARQGSPENSAQQSEMRPSPLGARKEFENGGASTVAAAEKEARTKAFYSKLDKEDNDREAARRAVPFVSSLSASLGPTRAQPFKSSLKATLEPTRTVPTRAQKIVYSLTELRGLMAFAVPRPADLMDMKIVEVIQVRDPQSVVPRRSAARVGRGAGFSGGRSGGGGGIRKTDRFGSGGSRGPLPRHQGGQGGGRRDRERHGGRGGRGGGRGGRGGGRGYGAPSPPLYDGPIEPLKVTENGWKAQKEKEVSPLETMLSYVKSLLNKLTREKFAKLTKELCSIDIDSMTLLRSIVSIIMDKAMEEANFADVYADLCKEFHVRTHKKTWKFVHVLEDDKGAFHWAAIDKAAYESFAGPFESAKSCLEDAKAGESTATSTCEHDSLPSVRFHLQGDYVLAVGEKEKGAFYYSKRKISELSNNEPIEGPFASAELAQQSAATRTTFTRLLVTRCQLEFEKTIKHTGPAKDEKEGEEVDPRRREILAMRAKARMLGNIRFIGELFKVDMIKLNVVQGCIFYLLGLELITGEKEQDTQAQAVRLPENEDLEALCKMLATVGKKLDQPKTKMVMKIIILRMVELSDNKNLPSRPRFLLKDVLEMRDHMWEPRRKEMQQKTLNEIRREAQKLQQQGKNAQHDDLRRRRHKTQITSAQLARQSSNLIVEKMAEPEQPDEPADKELSPAQMSSRIKNIIQEYISIVDLDEAATCVQELPVEPSHVEFAEQTISTALEGKTHEREPAVELLVGLYERGVLNANSIQAALVNVVEFLEDMRIDLPLVHQYSALVFGRLVAAGCFGLSWIVSEALAHVVECKLTSLVFPEVLNVLEEESDEATVVRMLADEEIAPGSVLPVAMRCNEAEVQAYLRENGIEEFFDGNGEDELDPEVAAKMRSTLEEYLSVKDFDEVVRCVEEFENVPDRWRHFVHTLLVVSLEAKQAVRVDMADLLLQLFTGEQITSEDVEAAAEPVLEDYDDLHVDIPQLATNLGELWTPLFEKQALSAAWLADACVDLVGSGRAADVFSALFSEFETRHSQEELVAWWKTQPEPGAVWTQLTPGGSDADAKQSVDAKLAKWKNLLQ